MMRSLIALTLLFSTVGFCQDEGREKYNWTLGYQPDKQISFYSPSPDVDLKLHAFFPKDHKAEDQRSCIVFFFGGGWVGGDPSQFYGFSKYLASRGMVAISAQYRHARNGLSPRDCVQDGRAAIRYVRAHAQELGIDSDRIAAGGGSAGGHVAAAVALCSKLDAQPDSDVSGVPNALVLFNPVYNNGPDGFGYKKVQAYWQEISPFHNIREGSPPAIAFFGSNDKHISVEQINAFQDAMIQAGNVSDTHIYDGEAHGFFHISKGGRNMFEDTLTKTDAFLVEQGFLSGPDQVKQWTENAIKHYKSSRAKGSKNKNKAKK